MIISEVNITLVKPRNGLIAFASIVINDAFFLGSIAIHQKLHGGFRLTYPTKQSGSQHMQIYHPINRTAGEAIETAVISKLNDVMTKVTTHARHDSHIHF